MKHTLFLFPTLVLAFAALAQPSPTLPPTRLAPGSGVTITTNGVNNFTIAASGGSSVTNLGNGSNTLLATNLQVYSSGTTNRPLRVYGTNGTSEVYVSKDGVLTVPAGAYNAPSLVIGTVGNGFAQYSVGSPGIITWLNSGIGPIFQDEGVGINQNDFIWFSNSDDPQYSGRDVALKRTSAGLLEVNSGTLAAYRDIRLRTLQMYAQPSDPSSSATLGMIYSKTNAGTTEVFVMDGAGNVTQISPHARAASPAPPELDTDAQPIVIHHANLFLGTEEFLHLSALAKEVEKISGKKFMFQRQLDPARKRDWATEETASEQAHAAERAADLALLSAWQSNTNQNKGPQPPVRPAYVKRPKPAWLP